MGRYYALHDGQAPEVADAIRDYYKPLGPSDAVPIASVSIAVALADKLDTLGHFFALKERPTGSGDPYALRRAALGIIRVLIERDIRVSLKRLIHSNLNIDLIVETEPQLMESGHQIALRLTFRQEAIAHSVALVQSPITDQQILDARLEYANWWLNLVSDDVLAFFADRLKVALREKGIRHDLIDAVFALGNEDDLVRLVRRVEALQAFLKTDDGANLLIGYRRAANILKIEEKKDKREYRGIPDGLKQDEEVALQRALTHAKVDIAKALSSEDFADALRALASLRVPVDRFFERVTVNTDDKTLRENRLMLLSQIVETAHQIADFSKVEG
jgi:glycyl-tRNA synthetase beta chain